MIAIKLNTKNVEQGLSGLRADMPWVISSTINDLLKEAQQEQYKTMRRNFTIRNEAFLKYSVRLAFAKRNNPEGKIFMADLGGKNTSEIWERFEGGGTKTPKSSKYVAVPSPNAWANKGRPLPKSKRPRNLKNSFVIKDGSESAIYQRVGPKKRSTIQRMYILTPSVRIPDRLHFYKTVIPVVRDNYESTINRLLAVSLSKRGFK
jgi:hypothetical protein